MEDFIKNITEQIRCVRAREGIAHELKNHILDQAEAFEASGESHNEALQKAIKEMGDPIAIGTSLDQVHRPQTDWKMIIMVFLFYIIGLALLYFGGGLSQYPSFFAKQCFYTLGAFAVIIGIYFLDYSFIGQYARALYVLFTLLCILIAFTQPQVYGAVPALSMLVYLYIPLFAGFLYYLRGNGIQGLIKAALLQIVTALLTASLGNRLSASFNIYIICFTMLLLALYKNWFGIKQKKAASIAVVFALVLLPALLGVWITFHSSGFRAAHIRAWFHPDQYEGGTGYIYLRIREGLAASKLIGASDTPVSFQDGVFMEGAMILLQLIGVYGILAGLLVLLALTAFITRALHIVQHQKNQLGFMISASCCMVFLVNCLESIFISTGCFPFTKVQLPFLSGGGSATLTYAVFIGLLLSIHRNEKILTDTAIIKRPIRKLRIKLEREN
jgi:Bacterial cell division membrane protein